ncbi:hypothetical protein C9374_006290 [Naegleria lovaniensis]|uniref:ABM domain-containing protein n=1 Tax=Naegleria lovaniensis TaxID=51637 RepID=A0AA88GHY6_NAELO|nr:uncharacterized protein C9374_006290 [Naegleria lovaniensis]KAG2381301.1 hypothetical protein C9374_006290 [Naegleria lovaniensis]
MSTTTTTTSNHEQDIVPKQEPFVLMNPFHINIQDEKEFEEGWLDCARFLQTQDGFLKTALHKAIAPEKAHFQYMNYALWENPLKFSKAIQSMKEQGISKKLDQLEHECFPSLYQIHLEM